MRIPPNSSPNSVISETKYLVEVISDMYSTMNLITISEKVCIVDSEDLKRGTMSNAMGILDTHVTSANSDLRK